jgi:hypothetical protein
VGDEIFAIIICVLCVAGTGWIIWVIRHGEDDRHEEDAARRFFDEHGHWPDETAEEAEAERLRRRAAEAQSGPALSTPGDDGVV